MSRQKFHRCGLECLLQAIPIQKCNQEPPHLGFIALATDSAKSLTKVQGRPMPDSTAVTSKHRTGVEKQGQDTWESMNLSRAGTGRSFKSTPQRQSRQAMRQNYWQITQTLPSSSIKGDPIRISCLAPLALLSASPFKICSCTEVLRRECNLFLSPT